MLVRPVDRHPEASGEGHPSRREPAALRIAEVVRGAAPEAVPTLLCAVAVELLPVTGASVSVYGGGLPVQVGASCLRAARLTELQATLGDGPCLLAARTGVPVLAGDLTRGRDLRRWPVFAHEAAATGTRATYSIPLGVGAVCVGTLDLYRNTPGELGAGELRTAELVAGVLTVALMALPHEDSFDDGHWLGGLAADHDEVYQATGMVMAQLGIDPDEALDRLRAHAFARGRTVSDVAGDVVTHRVRFDDGG